jgi:hypothetical protein
MNKIDSYRFGQIGINDRKYTADVIIFPDRVQNDWWRDDSHQLTLKDIVPIFNEEPEVLLVGTGASGMMRVSPEVEKEARGRHIQLIIQPTGEACEIYNQLSQTQRVIAALHLTC